jgi:hypothetical protein
MLALPCIKEWMTHTFGAYLALVSTQPSLLMKLYVKGRSDLILGDVFGSLGPRKMQIFPMVGCS